MFVMEWCVCEGCVDGTHAFGRRILFQHLVISRRMLCLYRHPGVGVGTRPPACMGCWRIWGARGCHYRRFWKLHKACLRCARVCAVPCCKQLINAAACQDPVWGTVGVFLPRNTNLSEVATLVPPGCLWRVVRYIVGRKFKGVLLLACNIFD